MAAPPPKETPRGQKPRERERDERPASDRSGRGTGTGGGRGSGGGPDGREDGRPSEATKAGILAHNAAYARSNTRETRAFGFQQTPSVAEIVEAQTTPREGEPLAEILPQARMPVHPDLPPTDLEPPAFLTPLEAMSDVYMRTRGRMSNKTKMLLESPDLEDLIRMLTTLHTNPRHVQSAEGRVGHRIWSFLKDDPGPLLLGLNDKRLTEPWRLFLDRWDIWVPDDEDEGGVELFWEGEGEADDGESIEILQSLVFKSGELTFYVKIGDAEDRITFDGETFYRLKSDAGEPR